MKNILLTAGILLMGLCFYPAAVNAQTPQSLIDPYNLSTIKVSYVRSWQALKPEGNPNNIISTADPSDYRMTTQYLDGLGRHLQTVSKKTSPLQKDIVSAALYDEIGRERLKYLSFASTENSGLFKANPFQQQRDFYNGLLTGQANETNIGADNLNWAYSKTNFEASPLNRVNETFAPGTNWVGSETTSSPHAVKMKYWTNTTVDNVRKWSIGSGTPDFYVTVVNNGNGTQTVTYYWPPALAAGASTSFIDYRSLPSGTWNSISNNPGTATAPRTYTIPVGTYEYSVAFWKNGAYTSRTIYNPSGNNNAPGVWGTYSVSGSYGAGELYKNVVENEHGNQIIEFKDKEGKVILKKVQLSSPADDGTGKGHPGWLCTYYIYDELANLRCVVQPQAVKLMDDSQNWDLSPYLNGFCFRYEFDDRKRMIMKKIPGAGELYLVYDKRGRLVMTQDANLRAASPAPKWLITKYDDFNRVIESGLWESSVGFTTHLQNAIGSTSYPVTGSGYEKLSENHYDDYAGLPSGLSSSLNTVYINGTNFITSYNTAPEYAQQLVQGSVAKGKLTWKKVKILGTSNSFIETVNIYDDKERVIQVQERNPTNGIDIVTTQYDFSGKVLRRHQYNNKLTGTTNSLELLTKFQYDHAGRVLNIKKKLTHNGTAFPEKSIADMTYDENGRLKSKELGLNLETETFDYNIRDWILGMNRDYLSSQGQSGTYKFGYELGYDKLANKTGQSFSGQLVGGNNMAQFNGNINGMAWKSDGDDVRRIYDFVQDNANRFLKADFKQDDGISSWNSTTVNYKVQMGDGLNPESAYDANGNIIRMVQYGWKPGGSTDIDNMIYTYFDKSNKLKAVTETGGGMAVHNLGDFTDKNTSAEDYGYDRNGNMVSDLNKKIIGTTGNDLVTGGAIGYNFMNLPQTVPITKDDNSGLRGTLTYLYDATGNRLQKSMVEGTKEIRTTYLGNAVYEDVYVAGVLQTPAGGSGSFQFISHEEGRIRVDINNTLTPNPFDYFIKDHLGNVRMVITDELRNTAYTILGFENDDAGTPLTNELNDQNAQWENGSGTSINVTGVRSVRPSGMGTAGTNGSYVREIKRSTGAIGAGKLLKVMAGDRIHAKVDYYYTVSNSAANNVNSNPLNSFVNSLISVFSVNSQVSGALKGNATAITNSLSANTGFTSVINPAPGTSGSNEAPKAYLNILFFDDQFKYDPTSSLVIKTAYAVNSRQVIDKTFSNAVTANKSGYVYVYFSNESETPVSFDNFMLTHEHGSLREETHYYPFGLTMTGISSKAVNLGGRYNQEETFQGQQKDSEAGLDWILFKWRSHDPQIGRFLQVDPLSDRYQYNSTYAFSENSVINAVELEGLEKIDLNDTGINPEKHKNKDGSYTFTLGQTQYSNVQMIQRGGESFFDLTPYLKGGALYYNSKNEFGWSNTGAAEDKLTIDNDIFDPPYNPRYNDPAKAEEINCAGMVFREKDKVNTFIGKAMTELYLKLYATPVTGKTVFRERDVLITFQNVTSYTPGYIDGSGKFVATGSATLMDDFHVFSAPLGPRGRQLPNYVTTNGRRPVFSGLTKNEAAIPVYWKATSNDRYNRQEMNNGHPLVLKLTFTVSEYIMK